jgi:carbonic anhydrase/acetyltransferase-like protein (isoleucine patch superfamily)
LNLFPSQNFTHSKNKKNVKKLEKLQKLLRCYLERCTIDNAIIGLRSRVDAGAVIRDAMLIGADYYESAAKRAEVIAAGGVPIGVGADSVVSNAIVDKNARIGKNCTILNKSGVDEVRREEKGRLERESRGKKRRKNERNSPVFPPPLHLFEKKTKQADRESDGFFIRSGIVVVLRNATLPDGTTI